MKDAYPDDVAGEQVGSELDAVKRAIEGASQGIRQGGFTDAGDVFDQQVAASKQRRQSQLDNFFLALDESADRFLDGSETGITGWDRLRLQFWPFCYRIYVGTGD